VFPAPQHPPGEQIHGDPSAQPAPATEADPDPVVPACCGVAPACGTATTVVLPLQVLSEHAVASRQVLRAANAVTQFAPSACAQTFPLPVALHVQATKLGQAPPLKLPL
jgi:hypothetical protein